MAILVQCSSCSSRFRTPDGAEGQTTKCPKCDLPIVICGQRVRNHDVFISYSSHENSIAQTVCASLERHRLRCWIAPRNIAPGFDYADAIIEGIEQTGVLLVIVSEAANKSPHVKREVERAASKRIPIIPFRVEDVTLSKGLEFFLSGSHWHDALSEPMEDHVVHLLPALRRLLKLRDTDDVDSSHGAHQEIASCLESDSGQQSALTTEPMGTPVKAPIFHFGGVVPPAFFIGRMKELEEAERAVCSQRDIRNNILVIGELRSGKTSFGKMLIHRIMQRGSNDVLGVYLNVQQWPKLDVESFYEHTILALFGEISRQVFGVRYNSLASNNPTRGRDELANDKSFGSFLDIYREVRHRTYADGAVAHEAFQVNEFSDVSNELMSIVREKDWTNCFVFYDEANRLGREESVDMILSHQEALSMSGLTAIYAASPAMVDQQKTLQDAFVHQIRLGPFCSHTEMRQLLARYYFDDNDATTEVPANGEALEELWKMSRGMPFLIQLIAGRSFEIAHHEGDCELSPQHVKDAYARIKAEKPTAFTTGSD